MRADDAAAEAVFLASLPTGERGQLIPGHTTWDDLGVKGKERYRRMAQAALDAVSARLLRDSVAHATGRAGGQQFADAFEQR